MKKKWLSFLLISLFGLLMVGSSGVSPASAGTINVAAFVDDAFYADLDEEGDTYDIQYEMSVYLLDFTYWDWLFGYDLTLYIGLEYPSGLLFWYKWDLTSYEDSFYLKLQFADACYESGWYNAHLIGVSAWGTETYVLYHQLTFDPPGSTGGTGPPALLGAWMY